VPGHVFDLIVKEVEQFEEDLPAEGSQAPESARFFK